jgi:hypothetical protein
MSSLGLEIDYSSQADTSPPPAPTSALGFEVDTSPQVTAEQPTAATTSSLGFEVATPDESKAYVGYNTQQRRRAEIRANREAKMEDRSNTLLGPVVDEVYGNLMGIGDVVMGGMSSLAGGLIGGAQAIASGDPNKLVEAVDFASNILKPSRIAEKYFPGGWADNLRKQEVVRKWSRPFEALDHVATIAGEKVTDFAEDSLKLNREASATLGAGVKTAASVIPMIVGAKGVQKLTTVNTTPSAFDHARATWNREAKDMGFDVDAVNTITPQSATAVVDALAGTGMPLPAVFHGRGAPNTNPNKQIPSHAAGETLQTTQMRRLLADTNDPDVFKFIVNYTLQDSPLKTEILTRADEILQNRQHILDLPELKGVETDATRAKYTHTHEGVDELMTRLVGKDSVRPHPQANVTHGGSGFVVDTVRDALARKEDVGSKMLGTAWFIRNMSSADTIAQQLGGRAGEIFRSVAQKTFDYTAMGKQWLVRTNAEIQPFNDLGHVDKIAATHSLINLDRESYLLRFKGKTTEGQALRQEVKQAFRNANGRPPVDLQELMTFQRQYLWDKHTSGLPQHVVDGMVSTRQMFNKTFDTVNLLRRMRGLPDLPKYDFYFPRIFSGKFTVNVNHNNSHYGSYPFETKWAANQFLKEVESKYAGQGFTIPETKEGKIIQPRMHNQPADLIAVIEDNMHELLTSKGQAGADTTKDFLFELQDKISRKAFAHEKTRMGSHGYIGDPKDILNPAPQLTKKEMKQMHGLVNKYIETVANHIKDTMISRHITDEMNHYIAAGALEHTPNLNSLMMEFISRNTEKPHMWSIARGANEILENIATVGGHLPTSFVSWSNFANGVIYHSQMFAKAAYVIGNLTQVQHALGRLTHAHIELLNSGGQYGDISKAIDAANNAFAPNGLKRARKDPYLAQGLKYLEDNGYIQIQNALHQDATHLISQTAAQRATVGNDPSKAAKYFWDQMRDVAGQEVKLATNTREQVTGGLKTGVKTYETGMRTFYEWLEQRNRTAVAVGALEYFKGVFPKDPIKAADAATRLMNQTMGSYERGRGAGFYTHMGHIGTALKPFTTLRNQYLGNFVDDFKLMVNTLQDKGVKDIASYRAIVPLLVGQAVFMAQAGLAGVVGMKEVESAWQTLQQLGFFKDLPSVREFIRTQIPADMTWLSNGLVSEVLPGKPAIGGSLAAPTAMPTALPPIASVPYELGSIGASVASSLLGGNTNSADIYPHVHNLAPSIPTIGPVRKIQEWGQDIKDAYPNSKLASGIGLAMQSTSKLGAERGWSNEVGDGTVPKATRIDQPSVERTPREERTWAVYGTQALSEQQRREVDRLMYQKEQKIDKAREKYMGRLMDAAKGVSSETVQEALKAYNESDYKKTDQAGIIKELVERLKVLGISELKKNLLELGRKDPVKMKILADTYVALGVLKREEIPQ